MQECKLTLYGTSQPAGGFGKLLAQQEFHRPKLIKQIISQINLFSYFDHQTSIFHSISSFFSLVLTCSLRSSFLRLLSPLRRRFLDSFQKPPHNYHTSRHVLLRDSGALVCDVRLTSECNVLRPFHTSPKIDPHRMRIESGSAVYTSDPDRMRFDPVHTANQRRAVTTHRLGNIT